MSDVNKDPNAEPEIFIVPTFSSKVSSLVSTTPLIELSAGWSSDSGNFRFNTPSIRGPS